MEPNEEIAPGIAPFGIDLAGLGAGFNQETPIQEPVRKRGRPKGSRNKPKVDSDGSSVDDTGNVIPAKPEPPKIPRETVERALASLVTIVDASVQRAIRAEAFAITTSETDADDYREQVAVKTEEKEEFAKLGTDVLEQYGLLGKHSALVFLSIFVLGYITRVSIVTFNLRKLRQEKRKIEQQNKSTPLRN